MKKPNLDQYDLASRISYLREHRRLTQKQLADRSKVSQSTIAQLESRAKDPSVSTLVKIANALEVHVAILFASDDVHIFDMKKLRKKYKKAEDLNKTVYFALGTVIKYARDINFIPQ